MAERKFMKAKILVLFSILNPGKNKYKEEKTTEDVIKGKILLAPKYSFVAKIKIISLEKMDKNKINKELNNK
jgi:hypothetical protein